MLTRLSLTSEENYQSILIEESQHLARELPQSEYWSDVFNSAYKIVDASDSIKTGAIIGAFIGAYVAREGGDTYTRAQIDELINSGQNTKDISEFSNEFSKIRAGLELNLNDAQINVASKAPNFVDYTAEWGGVSISDSDAEGRAAQILSILDGPEGGFINWKKQILTVIASSIEADRRSDVGAHPNGVDDPKTLEIVFKALMDDPQYQGDVEPTMMAHWLQSEAMQGALSEQDYDRYLEYFQNNAFSESQVLLSDLFGRELWGHTL